jgi:hypothetical protein
VVQEAVLKIREARGRLRVAAVVVGATREQQDQSADQRDRDERDPRRDAPPPPELTGTEQRRAPRRRLPVVRPPGDAGLLTSLSGS